MNFFSFVDHIRQLEGVNLVFFSASIESFNVTKVNQSHPRAFSDAPRATRVTHFWYATSRLGTQSLAFFRLCL